MQTFGEALRAFIYKARRASKFSRHILSNVERLSVVKFCYEFYVQLNVHLKDMLIYYPRHSSESWNLARTKNRRALRVTGYQPELV